jgi:hypothetical protein
MPTPTFDLAEPESLIKVSTGAFGFGLPIRAFACLCTTFGAVGQRPKSRRPVVAELLSDRCSETDCLEASSLCFSSLKACPAVVGGVQPVASALDEPDRGNQGQGQGRLLPKASPLMRVLVGDHAILAQPPDASRECPTGSPLRLRAIHLSVAMECRCIGHAINSQENMRWDSSE